tara:strand:- start:219 stop:446 length:228 start_codon:yes stop_codon:yes gene_type:complete
LSYDNPAQNLKGGGLKCEAAMPGRLVALWIIVPGAEMVRETTLMNRDFDFSLTFAIPEAIAKDEIEERLSKAGWA